ncbi:MAG: protein kinase [Planctomycetota bacterium]
MTRKNAIQLFEELIDIPSEQRLDFLRKQCVEGSDVYRQVIAMLENHPDACGFLETDAIQISNARHDSTAFPVPLGKEASQLTIGDRLLGRYQVVASVGRGGMGEVYRCSDLQLARHVAIKVQRRSIESDPAMRDRFLREIRSVAALSHPNVVNLHDFATDGELSFAVMEFVCGESLDRWIKIKRNSGELISVARDVAAGLSAAHLKELMHRDIKPANVMITEEGIAKILDFGLARRVTNDVENDITGVSRQIPGTAPYMSPEQARGEPLSCATDLFSFGTMLYEMFAGENPYRGASFLETIQRVSEAHSVIGRLEKDHNIPHPVAQLIAGMQQRDPKSRPDAASVAQVLEQIARFEDETAIVLPASGEGPTNNLPSRAWELEGRDATIEKLRQELDQFPVVSIVGAGGVGKTALAIHVAQQSMARFTGGVWFCDLTSVDRGSDLTGAIAGIVMESVGSSGGIDELLAALSGGPVLLILDNCEHVIDDAAAIVEALCEGIAEITILITSRERLSVARERVHRLDGLAVDGTDSHAAELFRQRATRFAPLDRGKQTSSYVRKIVSKLEGLPLSIELAASCLKTMTIGELHASLDDQLSTLRGGRRKGRHATLHQTIAWSFDLLTTEEQLLLQAAAIFAGEFTSEAALAVCDDHAASKMVLKRLVEQSMIVRTERDGHSRFRLLEPIRQYCQSAWHSEQQSNWRRNHAVFFAGRAVALGRGIYGENECECVHALNREWPDIRRAIAWGRENHVMDIAVDPIVAITRTAMMHLRIEAFDWMNDAIDAFGDEATSRSDVQYVLATGMWVNGDYKQTQYHIDRSISLRPNASALYIQFAQWFAKKNAEKAWEVMLQARAQAESSKDELENRWLSLPFEANALTIDDPHDPRIDDCISTAVERVSALDWPTGLAYVAMTQGVVAMTRGKAIEAKHYLVQCRSLAEACGNRAIASLAGVILSGLPNTSDSAPEQLRQAVSALKLMIESGIEIGSEDSSGSMYPATVRSIIVALVKCGRVEDAVRCAGIIDRLRGGGDADEYSPGFITAMQEAERSIGPDESARLKQTGSEFSIHDVLQLGETVCQTLTNAQDD